jgi:hypothetical protein
MNRLPIVAAIGGFLIGVLLISMAAICPPLHAASAGKTRTYYIAAEEATWDYAPAGRDVVMGMDLYEPGTVKPDFSASFALSSILLFDLKSPFFRPDPGVCGSRRARSVKDGAIAPPAGLSLTDRAPRYAGAIEGAMSGCCLLRLPWDARRWRVQRRWPCRVR